MKKILVGYVIDGRHSGIDKYLLGFANAAAENGVMLDFLTEKADPELQSHLASLGFGLIEIPSLKKPIAQYRALKRIIRRGGYDGVYVNISESFNCMAVTAAKSCGVEKRIVHSHASGVDRENKYVRAFRTCLNSLFRGYVSKAATRRLACSTVAGEWLFDKSYDIVYNAVDDTRFAFDSAVRDSVRRELGLEDRRVLIHIGHFCYSKNNFFLMDVMKKVTELDNTAVLLCAGTGYNFDAVCSYAKKLGIDGNVRFLGVRTDVNRLMCGADVFVFPSRFEGLSVTCVEAQFSGLDCVVSTGVSRETDISGRMIFLPADDPGVWAETIMAVGKNRRKAELSESALERYCIRNQKKQLTDILKG